MAINKLELLNWTTEKIKPLLYEHPERKETLRLFASYLVSKGWSARQLSSLFDVSFKQISIWVHDFDKNGISGLADKPKTGRTPKLSLTDKQKLKEIILYTSPTEKKISGDRWNAKNLEDFIKKEFGVTYKKAQIYKIIKSLNIKYINGNWRELL